MKKFFPQFFVFEGVSEEQIGFCFLQLGKSGFESYAFPLE